MPLPEPPIAGDPAGLVFDDRYLQHNPGLETAGSPTGQLPFVDPVLHLSNHRLVMRTKHLIDLTGLGKQLVQIAPFYATADDIALVHDPAYVRRVEEICRTGGGETGSGAPAGPDTYEIALLAAGGAMAAVDAVVGGTARRVFANVRPPGHHALAGMGMGFCIFNNVAITARHAQRAHGLKRIMIVDWDVHHGNGTQAAFYGDPDVLVVSLHQEDLYPAGSGRVEQCGEGPGEGFTVNLPLPPGTGNAGYLAAFERIILPIADSFEPELVLVSAGQDACLMDQLGRMCLTTEGFRRMTAAVIGIADRHAGGRLVVVQEGGYSELYGPYTALATVETLAGTRTGVSEPAAADYDETMPYARRVGLDCEAALESIVAQQTVHWPALRGTGGIAARRER